MRARLVGIGLFFIYFISPLTVQITFGDVILAEDYIPETSKTTLIPEVADIGVDHERYHSCTLILYVLNALDGSINWSLGATVESFYDEGERFCWVRSINWSGGGGSGDTGLLCEECNE